MFRMVQVLWLVSGYRGSMGLKSRSVCQEKTGNCLSGLWLCRLTLF